MLDLFIIGSSTTLIATILFVYFGNKSIPFLVDQSVKSLDIPPKVSILIAARNESEKLEGALTTLLKIDYPNYEIIAIDDRSTDATGDILDRISKQNKHVRVFHVTDLPPAWLGKNHALHLAATAATGELLLFTDADVHMTPMTLLAAVRYHQDNNLSHLAVLPEPKMPGLLLNTLVGVFFIFFSLAFRPWRAPLPRSSAHIGVGAFNLIQKKFYQWIGGHQAIALRPDDDVRLGKLVKEHSGRQRALYGEKMISVEWYATIKEMTQGLEKNIFAGADYQLRPIFLGTAFLLCVLIAPFITFPFARGFILGLNLIAILSVFLLFSLYYDGVRRKTIRLLLFPIAALIFGYILWRSTLITLIRRGIRWRGTFYPLADLKRGRE